MKKSAIVIFCFFCIPMLQAQAPPGTDIYLADLVPAKHGTVQLENIRNITRRNGYDNQPEFLPDCSGIIYTAIVGRGQADVFLYDIATGKRERKTRTPESEYSPTPMPVRKAFSVVRVEADSSQRLWQFPMIGLQPRVILPHVKPVGYHGWADQNIVAMFVLGSPPTLQVADIRSGKVDTLLERVGRSIHTVPGEKAISFLQKSEDGKTAMIKKYTPATGHIKDLVPALPEREDYAWLPDGRIIMGSGSVLYLATPGKSGWQEIVDLAGRGLTNITRLAVSPRGDRIAMVADENIE